MNKNEQHLQHDKTSKTQNTESEARTPVAPPSALELQLGPVQKSKTKKKAKKKKQNKGKANA